MMLTTAVVMTGLLAGANVPASSTEAQPVPSSSAPTFATPAVPSLNAPPARAPGASPAPAATAVATSPDAAAAATAKAAHVLGYSPRVREGKTMYCRKDAKVGTRFESTTCVTPEQVSALIIRAQGNKDSVVDLQREANNQQGGDLPPPVSQLTGHTYR